MDFLHAMLFALLQGTTELFPVSSLGHAVVVPAILHWNIDQTSEGFLPFLVMLHLGTAVGLLVYFHADWLAMLRGFVGPGDVMENALERQLFWRLVVATLPAMVIGVIVKKAGATFVRRANGSVPVPLIANAGLLAIGERLRSRAASGAAAASPLAMR